jgi:multidrug transporter EmrE-like cation transporter
MSWLTWFLILSGVGLNAAAQLLLKAATKSLVQFSGLDLNTALPIVLVLLKSLPFWAGIVCYGLSLCVWIAALTKAPVSTAYPMLSLGYVVVTVAAVIWLGESLSAAKIAGIMLICAGVALVSRGAS